MTCRAVGSLRHRVRLEEPLRTDADGGTATITWSTVAVLYAAIEAVSGREIEIGDRLVGRVTHKVTIRHRAGVVPHMRFVFGGRTFEIRSVLDRQGRNRWLECLCEERVQ